MRFFTRPTNSIALMLADEAMGHKPLIISGSPDFRKKVLEIALHSNLPISFQDNLLQNEFEEQKEDEENERNRFVANGGKIISERPNIKPAVAPNHAKRVEDATKDGFRLPTLSQRSMVYPKSRGTDVLLQTDELNDLDEYARECDKRVRWDFSGERKRLAKLTAQKILENVTEAMEEESSVSHVEYINRERAFANRGACIFHSHHLPWAKNDPKKFFQAADKYLQTLKKPDESDKEAIRAYEDVVAGVKAKIYSLFTASLVMKKPVEEIEERLESPECKNNILLVTHQILQANTHARKMLKRASDELDKAVDDLRNALFAQTIEEPQTSFKTREVYDLIRQQYRALKKEHEDLFADKFHLQRQIISPQRAIFMAKNIFVRGDYKRLREEIRRYKKEEQKLVPKLLAYAKEEKMFKERDWSIFPRSTFLQEQYYLTKQRTLLDVERTRLDQIKLSLQKKQSELQKLCQEHESVRKIETIAAGILRKNYRFVRQLEEIETRAKELIPRINHAKEQMDALEKQVARDKVNTRYRVTCSDKLTNSQAASIIADAIMFDPQVVQLVARSTGNNLEMEKDWELMSELDKDELLNKEIVREL